MQRVKAHELRHKDETSLVEELTKFRVRKVASVLMLFSSIRKNWLSLELARSPPLPRSSSHALE